jgi:Fe-S-cluster-containing dehydrogenase component
MNSSDSLSPRFWMNRGEIYSDVAEPRSDEFFQGAAVWPEHLSRRKFIQLVGGTVALAGLSGCMRLPEQIIVPYTQQPEKLIPGNSLHYATTLRINGHPRGVLVTQHEGRPTHISGNPLHPLSLGACDAWTTASLLDLYDPDRLQTVLHQSGVASWGDFQQALETLRPNLSSQAGLGLYLVTPPLCSPTEIRLMRKLLSDFPKAQWFVHDPLSPDKTSASEEQINLADADVIFSLESDFFFDRPDSLALIRAFSQRRRSDDGATWNRLYVAESCPTITGAKADHRFAVAPQDFDELAAALLEQLQNSSTRNVRWPWLNALADDLRAHPGRSAVLAGRYLSSAARTSLRKANAFLGNEGKSVVRRYPTSDLEPTGLLVDLTDHLKRGLVTTLILSGVNPVYDAAPDLHFPELLSKVPVTIGHSFYVTETSSRCTWVVPAAHDLEAWGDTVASDGIQSIIQPLIAPLYGGKSLSEVLTLLATGIEASSYDLVRETWQTTPQPSPIPSASAPPSTPDVAFDAQWHRWLRDGVISSPPFQTDAAAVPPPEPTQISQPSLQLGNDSWLISLRPSAATWDGRHANNGWLQELPDPLTKLTWDNAALLSPATAKKLTLSDGDVISIEANGAKLEAPVQILPGHADGCITLPLGYGRTVCGGVGKDVGFNAYLLRRSDSPWQCVAAKVESTNRKHALARTQEHFRVEGRDLLHVSRVTQGITTPAPAAPPTAPVSLYPDFKYEGHRWALSINLNSCVGCNACITACQSENNIPVVGKAQVLFGREMQWIRVDRYYEGSEENPRTHFQPVTCMQCEKAPCEVVCPVAATQHDDEGLNVMVYNRCVGTRYCSNNCPYKVRRFNFLFYNADIPESQRLRLNPNVTVRSRGVMEKCTYCVQRIEEARVSALRERRPLRGNDIITACQASCPAEAIVFGDLSDPDSVVSKNRHKPGHYAMLAELDTQPRTTYLEKLLNPNPALEPPPT